MITNLNELRGRWVSKGECPGIIRDAVNVLSAYVRDDGEICVNTESGTTTLKALDAAFEQDISVVTRSYAPAPPPPPPAPPTPPSVDYIKENSDVPSKPPPPPKGPEPNIMKETDTKPRNN